MISREVIITCGAALVVHIQRWQEGNTGRNVSAEQAAMKLRGVPAMVMCVTNYAAAA